MVLFLKKKNHHVIFALIAPSFNSFRDINKISLARVGISGTTAKSRKRKFVPPSNPGPFVVVASSWKSRTKVGTIACFDFL